jgi:hypothetical protein
MWSGDLDQLVGLAHQPPHAAAEFEGLVAIATVLQGVAIAGASAQNGGGNRAGNAGFALTVFGRSIRESNCDCDRSMDASLLQTVFLQNDGGFSRRLMVQGPRWRSCRSSAQTGSEQEGPGSRQHWPRVASQRPASAGRQGEDKDQPSGCLRLAELTKIG